MTIDPQPITAFPGWHRRTARTLEACCALEPAWRSLFSRASAPTLNAHPAQYAATVQAMAATATPEVTLLCDERDEPRALVIGRRSTRRLPARVGHIGLPTPWLAALDVVYGGVLTDATAAARAIVVGHILERLESGLDHIMINRLPVDAALSVALIASAGSERVVRCDPAHLHWRRRLPAGGELLDTFSRKHRYNARRADRQLTAAFDRDVRLECITGIDALEHFAPVAAAVTAAGYQSALGAGYRDTPVQRSLLRAAAERGALRCYALHAGGNVIAMHVGLIEDGIYHLEATAYQPDHAALSPGQVLLVRVLRDLTDTGCRAIDFGFGDAPYKRTYGSESRAEATLHLYRPTARTAAARRVHDLSTFIEHHAGRAARHWSLGRRAKRRWRRSLTRTR